MTNSCQTNVNVLKNNTNHSNVTDGTAPLKELSNNALIEEFFLKKTTHIYAHLQSLQLQHRKFTRQYTTQIIVVE